MRLADILAQEIAVRALKRSMERGAVAHAYLFTGPRGCGKTTTALAFASALNCADPTPEGDACGMCMSCIRIESGQDPDVQVISPAGDQTKMEQMQEMIKNLNYAPLGGKHRVFIIEQADTLNSHSENAILKILEEPPAYAVLILLSSNPNSLLPTIRSRCRTVRFRRAGLDEVEAVLRAQAGEMTDEQLWAAASCSQGLVGRALGMTSDAKLTEERQIVMQALSEFLRQPPVAAVRTAEVLVKRATPKKNDPDERTRVRRLTDMLDHILSWYADMISLKVRQDGAQITNVDFADGLRVQAPMFSMERLFEAVKAIMETRRYMEGNITPQLALECMFLRVRADLDTRY